MDFSRAAKAVTLTTARRQQLPGSRHAAEQAAAATADIMLIRRYFIAGAGRADSGIKQRTPAASTTRRMRTFATDVRRNAPHIPFTPGAGSTIITRARADKYSAP